MTEEELKKGWDEFSAKMPELVAEGSLSSTFVFSRVDTIEGGGLVTHMIAYNMSVNSHLGLVAYQLHSLQRQIDKMSPDPHNRKHSIARVVNLFNKLFQANIDSNSKKDLN